MKIELIQPFINATDAVLAEMLNGPAKVTEVAMKEQVYRRKGVAASVSIHGDIEGHVIFDLESEIALHVASALAGGEVAPGDEVAGETVCELANMVVGNAVTLLNDQGHSFKVIPPELHVASEGYACGRESEALVMCFETPIGKVFLNIALDYSRQRSAVTPEVSA
jgi:chemotaxis protein CheX